MAIGSKQIGWSNENNLLWEISNKLDDIISSLGTTPISYYYSANVCFSIGGVIVGSPIPLSIGDAVLTSDGYCYVINGINPGPGYTVTYVSTETCFVAPCQTTTTTTTTADQLCVITPGWSTTNLNVSTYANGDPIPEVQDPVAWAALTTGAWCSYDNNPANDAIYGKLYNWFAVNDPRGLAPTGYHVSTFTEWETLITCLGGDTVAGGKMKEMGTTHWLDPNTGATNSSGFTALGAGARSYFGDFVQLNESAFFWTSIEDDETFARCYVLYNISAGTGQFSEFKLSGFSVRVVAN